jgi:hypothetical protein
MIGNKEYLHTYKDDLPPSFYNGTLQSTGVIAWEREIDDWSQINAQGNKTDSGPSCVDLYNFNFDTCEVEIWRSCGGTNEVGEPVFFLLIPWMQRAVAVVEVEVLLGEALHQ